MRVKKLKFIPDCPRCHDNAMKAQASNTRYGILDLRLKKEQEISACWKKLALGFKTNVEDAIALIELTREAENWELTGQHHSTTYRKICEKADQKV